MKNFYPELRIAAFALCLAGVLVLTWDLFHLHTIDTAFRPKPQPDWVSRRNFAPMIGRAADGHEFTCPVPATHVTAAIQACREEVYRYNERLGSGHVGWVFVEDGTLIGDGEGIPHNYLTGNVLITSMKDRH